MCHLPYNFQTWTLTQNQVSVLLTQWLILKSRTPSWDGHFLSGIRFILVSIKIILPIFDFGFSLFCGFILYIMQSYVIRHNTYIPRIHILSTFLKCWPQLSRDVERHWSHPGHSVCLFVGVLWESQLNIQNLRLFISVIKGLRKMGSHIGW